MKNYRLQDGCWNCKDACYFRGCGVYFCYKKSPICTENIQITAKIPERVDAYGICDDHEKEET